jgi:dimethylaniline monooxygenase (N-oxide forming)
MRTSLICFLKFVQEYVDYLRAYSKEFRIEDRINLYSKVIDISRDPGGGHVVSYIRRHPANREEWEICESHQHPLKSLTVLLNLLAAPCKIRAKYVAICSGLHVKPSIPDIPGIKHVLEQAWKPEEKHATNVSPTVFHSQEYKLRSQLSRRRVMILGTGETGMDLAYEAAKAGAKEVVLCSRSGYVPSAGLFYVAHGKLRFLSFPKALVRSGFNEVYT